MGKTSSFFTGALAGALAGAVAALLFTPASGSELIRGAEERWQLTLAEARAAMEERRRELESQYEAAKQS